MGLGRRQYRTIGMTGPGTVGPTSSFSPTFDNITRMLGGSPLEVNGQSDMWLYRGGMSIPGAYRAALLLANLLAGCPVDAFTTHGQDTPTKLDPRPLLLEQPAPPDTRLTTFRSQMLDYTWDGNAIAVIAARNASGWPTALTPVPAAWCGVRRISPQNANTSMLPIGTIEYDIGGRHYSSDQIIHVKGPCAPGALRGAGVLEHHLYGTLATAHEQEHQARESSRHGVPPGILKVHGEGVNGKKLQEKAQLWKQARDTGGVAAVNDNVDFEPLSWNPDQLQMIQSRQFTLLQLANIFGLPPSFLGAPSGNPLTYATAETEALSLLKFTMGAHFEQFEQTYSLLFPRGTTVKFDLNSFLKSDTLARYMAHQIARQTGWKLNSEIRAEENYPPEEGIDDVPTAAVQKQLNKELPITEEGLKQVTVGDLGGVPALPKGVPPIQATAQRVPLPGQQRAIEYMARFAGIPQSEIMQARASGLEFGQGSALWHWFVYGEGAAEWMSSPEPWTTLHDMLAKHDVPPGQIDGEVTNIMMATPAGRALFAAHHQGGH